VQEVRHARLEPREVLEEVQDQVRQVPTTTGGNNNNNNNNNNNTPT
jgi:hypothetical protein